MDEQLAHLRQLVARRDRLKGAFEQAEFELRKAVDDLRERGVSDEDIAAAAGHKRRPRLVRAPDQNRRQAPPASIDGRAEGFWTDD